MTGKRVLLIEPGYRNKYPPLGLMKLASYHRSRGDLVRFVKGEDRSALAEAWDRVYVTTLFSFEWEKTSRAIDFAIRAASDQSERVFVGGIAASLMHKSFVSEPRWAGVRFIQGLLDRPPATALGLSVDGGDFGADDVDGKPIEERVPDYGILDHVGYQYPVHDAYFAYASRGCVRKCAFCGVPKLEGDQRDMPPLSQLVHGIAAAHGERKDLILMDNNVAASSRFREIIAEIRDLGFSRGAQLQRKDQRALKRRVDFNQGVDARFLAKSPMYLREMATICISPLRIAFDHMGVRRVYEKAIRMAADNLITSLSNYMLYNFMDTPADLYARMQMNILLNEELGIRIWSFPMRYQPVDLKDRSHVGVHWSRYFLRSFQIMLQATRGVVSGSPTFFRRAYGSDAAAFEYLLSLPHAFIFHRNYYEHDDGRPIRDEYEALRTRLTPRQERDLYRYLEGPNDWRYRRDYYQKLVHDRDVESSVRSVIRFHLLDTKSGEGSGVLGDWIADSRAQPGATSMPEEEIVEDAGLFDHDHDHEAREADRTRTAVAAVEGGRG